LNEVDVDELNEVEVWQNEDNDLETWMIILIVLLCLAVLGFIGYAASIYKKFLVEDGNNSKEEMSVSM